MHCSVFVHSVYRVWSPPVHSMFTECWYCGRQSQIRSCLSGSARGQPFTPYPSLEKRFSWPGSSIWQEQWQALEHHCWMGPCGTTQRLRMTSDLSRQCWPLNTFWPLWTRRVSILHDLWFDLHAVNIHAQSWTCLLLSNMIWTWFHVLEHDFMFWNMISCSQTWSHVHNMFKTLKQALNMISCSITWFHVPEHEIVFRKHALCLRTWIMFWNVISCSWTWFHVLEHHFIFWNMISRSNRVQVIKHDFNMKSCSKTWFHVPEHEIMKSCSENMLYV